MSSLFFCRDGRGDAAPKVNHRTYVLHCHCEEVPKGPTWQSRKVSANPKIRTTPLPPSLRECPLVAKPEGHAPSHGYFPFSGAFPQNPFAFTGSL